MEQPTQQSVDIPERQWQAIHTEILAAAKTLQDDTAEIPTKLISRPSGTVLIQENVFLLTAE